MGELVNSLRDGGTAVGYAFNARVKVHRGQVMRKARARSLAELVGNGRQAKALSPKVESALDQGLITSLLLLTDSDARAIE